MSYYNQLLTILENSDLSSEDKDLIIKAFLKMRTPDQLSFIVLLQGDSSRLGSAVRFLREISSQKKIKDEQIEDYLHAFS